MCRVEELNQSVHETCCIYFDSCSIYLYSRDDICVFADGFRTVDTD